MGHTTTSPVAQAASDIQGEHLQATERLIIAPRPGVFEPAIDLNAGRPVAAGQVIGHLTSGADRTPVVSPFAGQSGAPLAWAGERVTSHQPVMWLRAGTPSP